MPSHAWLWWLTINWVLILETKFSEIWTPLIFIQVPLRSRHFLSQKLWYFHKKICSCVENECRCVHRVNISNVNFTSKLCLLLSIMLWMKINELILAGWEVPSCCTSPRPSISDTWCLMKVNIGSVIGTSRKTLTDLNRYSELVTSSLC